jgi:two-component sensor histidine kinase
MVDVRVRENHCIDVQGYLYGAFNNTITRFEPAKLGKANSPPGYFIESVLVAGHKTIYHPAEKIELNFKQNNLVINQAAINFNDPHLQQFAYRFVKVGNEQWQNTGTQQSIILSNLFPGKHKLQLKIFTPNNNWPAQIRDLTIVIRPPFWQTTWFMALAGSLLVLSLYFLYRHRVKRIHQRANIDKQLAELEIKGLHAQMNPHFIFNSLNSIKEMILENEKTNASRYLSKFAQLIRTNLEQSRQAFITVNQCVDHLAQYLEMEKIRFSEFSYVIDVDESLKTGDVKMAPMLVQPLVENAIWHGLRTKEGDKMIRIRFHHSGNKLVCEIEDNGIGINQSLKKTQGQSVHRSLGITNIRERISVLNEKYGMGCSLEIIDRSEISKGKDTGTIAILRQNIFNHSI